MPRFSIRQPKEVKEKGVTKALVDKYEQVHSAYRRIGGWPVDIPGVRGHQYGPRSTSKAAAEQQGVDLIIRRPRAASTIAWSFAAADG